MHCGANSQYLLASYSNFFQFFQDINIRGCCDEQMTFLRIHRCTNWPYCLTSFQAAQGHGVSEQLSSTTCSSHVTFNIMCTAKYVQLHDVYCIRLSSDSLIPINCDLIETTAASKTWFHNTMSCSTSCFISPQLFVSQSWPWWNGHALQNKPSD